MTRSEFYDLLAKLQETAPRQHQVLLLFLSGKTDDEIARTLYLTKATVRKCLERTHHFFDPDQKLSGGKRRKRADLVALFSQYKPDLVKTALIDSDSPQEQPISNSHLDSETICYKALQQPGALVRIKGTRLTGKTSTSIRILDKLSESNYRTVLLSFSLADCSTHLKSISHLLYWLCQYLTRDLELENKLDDYWNEQQVGCKVSCTNYLEDYILPSKTTPLVVCFDDVDLLFPYDNLSREFLLLLRSWYDRSKTRPIWRNLRLLIVHSTDVYIQLDINQSPFNVGWPIELSELTLEQIKQLAHQYTLYADQQRVREDTLNALYEMVGGHPYLIQLALSSLEQSPDVSLDQLLEIAPTEAGIYSVHLLEHWNTLRQNQDLAAAFGRVINSDRPIQLDPLHAYKLQRMGLIKLSGDNAKPRCKLYSLYFRNRLGSK